MEIVRTKGGRRKRMPVEIGRTKRGRPRKRMPVPLPEEILFLILLRLPLKSIARFRHLSKQWRSLLSSSYFHDHHRSLHEAEWNRDFLVSLSDDGLDLCLYAITEDKQATLVAEIPRVAGWHRARLLPPASCGLVCLFVDDLDTLMVCNPMTHEVFRLPAATPHDCSVVGDPAVGLGVRFRCQTAQVSADLRPRRARLLAGEIQIRVRGLHTGISCRLEAVGRDPR